MGHSFGQGRKIRQAFSAVALSILVAATANPSFAEPSKPKAVAEPSKPKVVPVVAQSQQLTLPPALQAAMVSGNSQAIESTLKALSGNDQAVLASLSERLIAAAEKLLQTNPQAAIKTAAVAVSAIRELPIQQTAPIQSQSVITIAARIFISPIAEQADPERAAALAAATVSAATNSNNPGLAASVASQSIALAEKVLTINPQVAVSLASSSVKVVQNLPVLSSSPDQAMQVVTTAARIIINPEVQRIAPQEAAAIAVSASQVATSPQVYAVSPTAAVQVMANTYQTVTSSLVKSAAPEAIASVRETLTTASEQTALNQNNDRNPAQIDNILNNRTPDTGEPVEKNTTGAEQAHGSAS